MLPGSVVDRAFSSPARSGGGLSRSGNSPEPRCDLPPFHALTARRTLTGWIRHSATVISKAASRPRGMSRPTAQMAISHPGMAALRLRMILRRVIKRLQLPLWPARIRAPHARWPRASSQQSGPFSYLNRGPRSSAEVPKVPLRACTQWAGSREGRPPSTDNALPIALLAVRGQLPAGE